MAFVRGINKKVVIAQESTFGTAGAGPGQLLRRVNATLSLSKDVYQSQEIITSQQIRDARHGVRRVNGTLVGQLAAGAYKDFFEGLFRQAWTASTPSGLSAVTSIASSSVGTFTKSGGGLLTSGLKVGDIFRWTGWTASGTDATANNNRNYRVVGLTDTVITVGTSTSEAVVTKTAGDPVTLTVVGKKLTIPQSGQTNFSYTIEQQFPDADTAFYEVFTGNRIQSMSLSLPSTGMAQVSASVIGQTMVSQASAQYASPTAANTRPSLVAVNGLVRLNGTDVAIITGANITITSAMDAQPVVGSNFVPDIFTGTIGAQGSMTIYLKDQSIFTLFNNETEFEVQLYVTEDATINSQFISIFMGRVKLTAANKNDSDRAIMQQVNFIALENTNGGTGTKYDATTISIQDSAM